MVAEGGIVSMGVISKTTCVVVIAGLEGVSCETNVRLFSLIVFSCHCGLVYYSTCLALVV